MEISAFVVVVALGSLLQGILRYGSAVVAVPLALIFLPKQTVVSSLEPSRRFETFGRVGSRRAGPALVG